MRPRRAQTPLGRAPGDGDSPADAPDQTAAAPLRSARRTRPRSAPAGMMARQARDTSMITGPRQAHDHQDPCLCHETTRPAHPQLPGALSTRRMAMTSNRNEDAEDQALLAFLAAQRDAVLSIVAGLDEEAWHRSVVPSGWTPAGLVEHLGGAEWHWFQGVVTGAKPEPPPGDEDVPSYDPTAAFVCDEPSAEIIGFYRDQCASSDAVLAVTPLSAATPRIGRMRPVQPHHSTSTIEVLRQIHWIRLDSEHRAQR